MDVEPYGAPYVEALFDVPGVVVARPGDPVQPPGAHPGLVLLDSDAGDEAREQVRRTWLDLYRRWDHGPAPMLRISYVTGLSREDHQTLMTPISRSAAGRDFQRYAVMAYPLTHPRRMVLELRPGTPGEVAENLRKTAVLAMAHDSLAEVPVIVVVGYLRFPPLIP